MAGIGKLNAAAAAPAAVPAMNLRRVTLRDIDLLPFDWPLPTVSSVDWPYLQQGDVSRGSRHPTKAHQVTAIIFKPFREVKPVGKVSSPARWAGNSAGQVR
jgi:hypothetical protein